MNNNAREYYRMTLTVYKDNMPIHKTADSYLTPQEFQEMDTAVGLTLPTKAAPEETVHMKVFGTIAKKTGKYPGVLTTTHIDRKAMEEKRCELEALLEEYGAQLNGSKHKHDAHLLSISEKPFSIVTNQDVDLVLSVTHVTVNH